MGSESEGCLIWHGRRVIRTDQDSGRGRDAREHDHRTVKKDAGEKRVAMASHAGL